MIKNVPPSKNVVLDRLVDVTGSGVVFMPHSRDSRQKTVRNLPVATLARVWAASVPATRVLANAATVKNVRPFALVN